MRLPMRRARPRDRRQPIGGAPRSSLTACSCSLVVLVWWQDNDGTVSPEEYIIFNLKKMGKVDEETLLLLRDQFSALDADGSGELDVDDISMLTQAASTLEAQQRDAEARSRVSEGARTC